MAITIASIGSGTLSASDNAISSVAIADTEAITGATIILTPTSALPRDLKVQHSMYVSALENGVGFTVSSSHKDLSESITFDYAIFVGTA